MKAAFVGGGAFRLVGILREALSHPSLFADGEIRLFDLNVARAQAVARMVEKTPEYAAVRCRITCPTKLEEAVAGVGMVGVILMAGSQRTAQLSDKISFEHGFLSSDNVSPSGAMLGLKGGPILLNVARKMEKYCPQAWLVDFANPIAVHSGMINNHTKIQAFGVCGGYTNHEWDLSRIFGKDEQSDRFHVECAGINHLSFIVKGTIDGKDLFAALDRRLKSDWKMCRTELFRSKAYRRMITRSVENIVRFYRELGIVIFSTEGDGMAHLQYEQWLAAEQRSHQPPTLRTINANIKKWSENRQHEQAQFNALIEQNLDATFWNTAWKQPGLGWAHKATRDPFVEIMRGRVGQKLPIVTSRLNHGAVDGFTDRTVLEYSQIIENGKFRPAGHYQVPAVAHGLLAALANHQTLLGDAMATDDPQLLAKALLAYPIREFSPAARGLFKALVRVNQNEIQPKLSRVVEYL